MLITYSLSLCHIKMVIAAKVAAMNAIMMNAIMMYWAICIVSFGGGVERILLISSM